MQTYSDADFFPRASLSGGCAPPHSLINQAVGSFYLLPLAEK
jgi:hypothetical protein